MGYMLGWVSSRYEKLRFMRYMHCFFFSVGAEPYNISDVGNIFSRSLHQYYAIFQRVT